MNIKDRIEDLGIGAGDRPPGFSAGYWRKLLSDVRNGKSLSTVTEALLVLVCDRREGFGGGVTDGNEKGVVPKVADPLSDMFDTDKKVSGQGDGFRAEAVEKGVPNKWGVIEGEDEVVPADELVEVSLSSHSLGMMLEHPDDMVWWREGLFLYFHFWEGVCGRVSWAEVKDHADYVVVLGKDSRLFSEFTKK